MKNVQKTLFLAGLLLYSGLICGQNQDNAHPPKDSTKKVIQLDPVVLRWMRSSEELPYAGSNLNKEDIETKIGNGSISNILDNMPSVVISSDAGTGIGYSSLRIRGTDGTRINVTVNGVPLNDAESQGTWFVNLPDFAAKVENLEVQRGVGSSTNGSNAFGASMNFSTNAISENPFVELSSSAGSFSTFRNAISGGSGLINNRFTAQASYSNIISKGYIDRSESNLNSFFFTGTYFYKTRSAAKGSIKFNLISGTEKTGQAWDGVPSHMLDSNRRYNGIGAYTDADGNTQYYDNETDNYKQTHYQLFYNHKFNKPWELNVNLHLTRGIGYYEQYKGSEKFSKYGLPNFILGSDTLKRTDLIRQKYLDNYFYGMTFDVSYRKINKLKWLLGGALNRYDGLHYGKITWMQYAGNLPHNYKWYNGTGDKINFNIFTKIDYKPIRQLNLYVDIQYRFIDYRITGTDDNLADIKQSYQWHFLNPKAGIFYTINRNHAAYFSFAMANREPTRSDLVDAPTAKKPTPETLYDFELGYQLRLKNYAFNANAYAMYYTNQLVLTGEINDVGDPIMTNVEKSYRIGLELVSSYQPVKFFRWSINGTFSINKILHFTEYVDDWDTGIQRETYLGNTDIAFSPNIIASNEFLFTPLTNFDISLTTKFVSQQFIDNTSNSQHVLKPYSVTNLNLSYTIHTRPISQIKLFFQINNLFNMMYESNAWIYRYYENNQEAYTDGYFPQAGINVFGGVALRFGK